MKRSEVDIKKISPMMKQYLEIKKQYEDTILFYRLGDFYEMFFEDAILASRELEIALTGRNAGLDERVPMCGVPYHSASVYIDKLIEKGYKVAICEQVEDPKSAKGIVKRDVLQIVTPGTVMEIESLEAKENNYIAALIDFHHAYAISYADISTGEFNALLISHEPMTAITEILNIGAKEVIMPHNIDKKIMNILNTQFKIVTTVYDNFEEISEYKYLYSDIDDIRYIKAITLLLNYLNETQKRTLTHLQTVKVLENKDYLRMDIHTKRNLELTETIRMQSRQGSLLWLLDKTKTAMGSRMLKKWIEMPLTDKDVIEKRCDIVETLLTEFLLRDELKSLLVNVYDLERLSARVAYGNANARDLLQLKTSLKELPCISEILKAIKFSKNINILTDLYNLLEKSIYESPPITIKEGNLIKEGFNKELDELKEARKHGKSWISKLEQKERERTGIKNLKVGYNKVFGYYIEVSKSNIPLIKEEYGYIRKQTLANGERYITPELKEKEDLILGAEDKIIALEYELFLNIRDEVKKYIPILQENAKIIAEIDVLQALSYCAEEYHFVRPTLTEKRTINIKDGRHPVVEKVMTDEFVPNDIIMNEDTNILLITGPNMSGKSTYMRQMAIIAILAQIGSFVPASSATLPIFDQIFTRIGASDDLVSGQSTFMIEMLDVNYALKNATEKSLILFDETGRGTATYDGMSIAQAIIEYIHENIHAKTLFSTHYHELTRLEEHLSYLKNIHVSALEENGTLTFLHKVKPGATDKSFGIHVARLAKIPDSIINRADEILMSYENSDKKRVISTQLKLPLTEPEVKESEIEKIIKEIDPLKTTPLEALTILYELKEKINKK